MPPTLLPTLTFVLPNGGSMRYGVFEPSGTIRGTILVVPGRREFIEKKHAELGPQLTGLGYKIVIVELRGQGLSSRSLTGAMRQRDHTPDFDAVLNDLRVFYQQVVQPGLSGPLLLHGHSMGGHYILRWLAQDHPAVAGAFVTAPMLALAGMPLHLTAHGLSWVGAKLLGHAVEYAPMQHDYGPEEKQFDSNPLTHDRERFAVIEDYFAAYPDLTVGGVTWGWALAALRSMGITHSRAYLSRIDVPVLSLTGSLDRVTPATEVARHLNDVPRMRTHILPGALHDILSETAPIRQAAWDKITTFIGDITP